MKKIRKAVIPVAGMGTRFLPVTKSVAKEMLPIVNKPTLHYIIEEAVQSGIEEILLITNPYKKVIEDYFDQSYELEHRLEEKGKTNELTLVKEISNMARIYTIRQGEPLGSGHAVLLAKNFVGDEPFVVMYGDDLMKCERPALQQLIDVYEKYDASVIGAMKVTEDVVERYGILELEDEKTGKLKTMVEKPKREEAPSLFAGLGRYIVKPEIFSVLEQLKRGVGNEYQFSDAMKELMKKEPFYMCEIDGTYYDTGNQFGYLKANIDFALQREDLKEQVLEHMKQIIEEEK